MERAAAAARFRERVAAFRGGYLLFLWSALLVTLVIAVSIGGFLYVTVWWLGDRAPRFLPFLAFYAGLFLAFGLWGYRRAGRPEGNASRTIVMTRRGLFGFGWVLPGLFLEAIGPLFVIVLLAWFPALVFHLLRELVTGRHLFASREVEEMALEILTEGRGSVTPELLQAKLARSPEAYRRAIRLLLEMRLLLCLRKGRERALVLSFEGMELAREIEREPDQLRLPPPGPLPLSLGA